MIRKNITVIIASIAILLVSCKKFSGDQEIPAYIHVDKFTFQQSNTYDVEGALTTNITDTWIYIDDNLQGCYELPCTVPILERGEHDITMYPGIKLNGISGTRVQYPFYVPFTEENHYFKDEVVDTINPTSKYYKINESTVHFLIEDYDNSHELDFTAINQSDTCIVRTERDDEYTWISTNSHYSGHVTLFANENDTIDYFAVATQELKNLPNQGNAVFLEIDYKCDVEFEVGLFANITGSIKTIDILFVKPSAEWNKIYVNLGPSITDNGSATYFKIFLAAVRGDLETAHLCFDNIKLVYRD